MVKSWGIEKFIMTRRLHWVSIEQAVGWGKAKKGIKIIIIMKIQKCKNIKNLIKSEKNENKNKNKKAANQKMIVHDAVKFVILS